MSAKKTKAGTQATKQKQPKTAEPDAAKSALVVDPNAASAYL